MSNVEKIWTAIGIAALVWVMTLLTLGIVYGGEFEGYYCWSDRIYASYSWRIDENAGSFTQERWKYIVENNLHLEKKSN